MEERVTGPVAAALAHNVNGKKKKGKKAHVREKKLPRFGSKKKEKVRHNVQTSRGTTLSFIRIQFLVSRTRL